LGRVTKTLLVTLALGNQGKVDKEKMINEILSSWEVPAGKSKEQAWTELQSKINQPTKVIPLWRRASVGVAVAACLALAVWVFTPSSDIATIAAVEFSEEPFLLPDGSKVFLNGGSTVSYDKASWTDERTLELDGHAFFEVEKGSRFTVQTPAGTVEVLGTSFDVFARGDYFEVACFTGKVEVGHGSSTQVLTPGNCTHLDSDALVAPEPMAETQHGWMDGMFAFTDASLGRVIEELEARFGYEIEMEGLADMRFSGEFTTTDIQEAMELVCLPLGLEFSIMSDMTVKVTKAS
jgi:transmembrane sensor